MKIKQIMAAPYKIRACFHYKGDIYREVCPIIAIVATAEGGDDVIPLKFDFDENIFTAPRDEGYFFLGYEIEDETNDWTDRLKYVREKLGEIKP